MRQQEQVYRRLAENNKWKKTSLELRGLSLQILPVSLLREPFHTILRSLDLSHNRLVTLHGIGSLKCLEELSARYNSLTEIPHEARELRNLLVLDLAHNKISDVSQAASLHELKTLNLSGNEICYLRKDIVFKCNLEKLHVTKNPIRNVPPEIFTQGLLMLKKFWSTQDDCGDWKACHMCTINRFMRSLQVGDRDHSVNVLASTTPAPQPVTSDYGTCTCSGDPPNEKCSEESSCHGGYDSGSELSVGSDCSTPDYDGATSGKTLTDSDEEDSERYSKTLCDHTRVLRHKKVMAVIPGRNINAYSPDEFTLDVIEDMYFTAELTARTTTLASPIVSLGPHGAQFYHDEPALIYLPLSAQFDDESQLICLCSNTSEGDIPDWHPIPKSHYQYIQSENKVMIRSWHFSLFTVVISCAYPEVNRLIRTDEETTLEVEKVKGVSVHFPDHSLPTDFEASVKVFYADDPTMADEPCERGQPVQALATPVVMFGPHGVDFAKDVNVQLPLPDCDQIMHMFDLDPKLSLKVYQSSTGVGEDVTWEPCNVELKIKRDESGAYYVIFPVRHFSWYKGVWDILASTLHGAKVGVSYFYPYIRFSMMCTAMMDETADNRSFGLEIICYRSDKKLPEIGNYKHRVGGSLKPKFVRPGTVVIRLVSNAFEADVLHGEDSHLIKEEPDFHGLEFEKQFACVYQGEPVKKGVIGKCIVERKVAGYHENIFEFNLTKYGNEGEFILDNTDGWSLMATRELASMLNITTDDNWKPFAKHLGFTKHEIKSKLSLTTDPFALIMGAFQSRGGTPDEFVQALYAVSRGFKMGETSTDGIGFNNSASGSGATFRGTTSEEDSDASAGPSRSSTPNCRKRRVNPLGGSGGYGKTKRQRSDRSESAASSYSSYHEDMLHRQSKQPLGTNDLWKISQFINQHWKSLGRNLSVPEEDLNQVEHAHKDMRECSYQMLLKWKERFPHKCFFGPLYTALCDSGLNSVATAHCIYGPRSPK